jgi:hypothetical protein
MTLYSLEQPATCITFTVWVTIKSDQNYMKYLVRLSPATSSIYILYIRLLQSSLKDSISYIYFLSNNVL